MGCRNSGCNKIPRPVAPGKCSAACKQCSLSGRSVRVAEIALCFPGQAHLSSTHTREVRPSSRAVKPHNFTVLVSAPAYKTQRMSSPSLLTSRRIRRFRVSQAACSVSSRYRRSGSCAATGRRAGSGSHTGASHRTGGPLSDRHSPQSSVRVRRSGALPSRSSALSTPGRSCGTHESG